MDRALAHARGCAEWLRVRKSTLGEVCGRGLFVALPPGTCAAGAADEKCTDYGLDGHGVCVVKKGSFAGFYRGEFRRRFGERPYRGMRKSHTMETDDFFIVPHPLALDAPDQVDVYEYRIAAVQEVPEGDVANAAFVRWYRVGDVLEAAPDGMARTATCERLEPSSVA